MQVVIMPDTDGLGLLSRFMKVDSYWQPFMDALAKDLADLAVGHIKPMTIAQAEWNGSISGTGALSNSIASNVSRDGTGFEITFDGLFYGKYMDVGNFPADSTISRAAHKPFPVGQRSGGDVTFSWTIHGMGYRTPGVPTHFSDKTAEWLYSHMEDISDLHVETFLRELVGTY